jgi:hypothetical protein
MGSEKNTAGFINLGKKDSEQRESGVVSEEGSRTSLTVGVEAEVSNSSGGSTS